MTPQYVRFLIEEVLEGNDAKLVPTYGNTLMGLAAAQAGLTPERQLLDHLLRAATACRPPRRRIPTTRPKTSLPYGDVGSCGTDDADEASFFLPRFLERDEVIRRRPLRRSSRGTASATSGPFGAQKKTRSSRESIERRHRRFRARDPCAATRQAVRQPRARRRARHRHRSATDGPAGRDVDRQQPA